MDRLGRFVVESELGRGAMGVVYKGFHPGLEVPIAIKVLGDTYSKDASFRRRFQREAAAIAALNHPGIVRVYDFDEDQASLFIVMEFVEGKSLRTLLAEGGKLPIPQALDIFQQLLSAVGAAHSRNIIHRDMKPDNVVISNLGKAKVMDFGIAKMLEDTGALTGADSIIGTPTYMSPEQVKGEPIDQRSDIYAMGAMLYELLHGQPPFGGQVATILHSQVYNDPPPTPDIPQPIMDVLKRAMAKERSSRFSTCEEFAGALLALDPAQITGQAAPAGTTKAPSGLIFRLPGLRARTGAVDPTAPNPQVPAMDMGGKGSCTESSCRSRPSAYCSYRDAMGRSCGTIWCSHHIQRVADDLFCRRHASVIKALSVNAGTIREIKHLPAVDDRAMALASLVGSDIDKDITEILRRRYSSRHDVTVIGDRALRESRDTLGKVAWERSWSAARSQGYETRITLAVSTSDSTSVEMRVGQRPIFRAVPDWIAHRLEGKHADSSDRARFRGRLVQAVTEAVDRPPPLDGGFHPAAPPPAASAAAAAPPKEIPLPDVDPALLEGLVMRTLAATVKLAAYEVADKLAVPFKSIEPILKRLASDRLVEAAGISAEQNSRPIAERMTYSLSTQGRNMSEDLSRTTTRYTGPAPVSLADYTRLTTEVILPGIDPRMVAASMDGLELAPGVLDAVRAAVNSRGSVFIYGAPGNGKTSLARRIPRLLRGPILVPVAIDLEGELMTVFDPTVHKLEGDQPADKRWRRVSRPLVAVGGEFVLEFLAPTWEPASRTYEAPLQVKANGGVLLIDDFGRQVVTPKQVLDRLMVPLEQAVDHLLLTNSGRKVEVPFRPLVAFSTNLHPSQLLDEAYLRRLAYKINMPDPTPQIYQRIFERERQRLGIPANPACFRQIGQLYGSSLPIRGNHPRDLLQRLVDVASARGVSPELNTELIDAAWRTLFVAT
ncbi:MAG: hypothetical protein E6I70_14660 [Chloroflexi bacterium]|nr:MAG: hypothetical protein E6I70_14660 [Chloroflexota bacterium]